MKKPKHIPGFKDIPTPRQKMPELPLDKRRLNFDEVELGLTEEMVLAEAARCLSCRRCIGCGLCLAECDQEAVIYDQQPEALTVEADAVVLTSDGQVFDARRKRELGYSACRNVITSYEFERLTSPNGPFGGLLVRPFDGDVPLRIGFVQCVGSRDEAIGANYCSVECCSRTLAQARRARQIVGQARVKVFHKGLRPIGKTSEADLEGLKAEDWVEFVETAVTSVVEDAETGTLRVTYSVDEKETSEDLDLLVLAVGIQAKRDFRQLARAGGLKTNKFGFADLNLAGRLRAVPGTSFAGAVCGPVSAERSLAGAIGSAGRSFDRVAARQAGPVRGKTQPVVFACEYGLGLAGKDGSLVKHLRAAGIAVEGIFPFLCYRDGRAAMARRCGPTSGLVVVGCHASSHENLFERLLGLAAGAVCIVGGSDLEDDAADRVRQAIEDLKKRAPGPDEAARPRTAVILGGGVSGLAAAHELLRRKVEVVIVDKADTIGTTLAEAVLEEGSDAEVAEGFVKAVTEAPGVTLLTGGRLSAVERTDGSLKVTVAAGGSTRTIEAGALLVATGSARYAPEEYPYGRNQAVISQQEFRALSAGGQAPWERVVMIQCVGARDEEHPYCSRFCCRQAISNALLHKANKPDCKVTIVHKGIRVFGFEEEILTQAVEQGVEFVSVAGKPEIEAGKVLRVKGRGQRGEIVSIDCDAVVLSLAHAADGDMHDLARTLGVELDRFGTFITRGSLSEPFAVEGADGAFVCGFARGPVVVEEAFDEGLAAAAGICRYLST